MDERRHVKCALSLRLTLVEKLASMLDPGHLH